ncbi:hypothetical protein HF995_13365 [Sanguibacter hominis ATCC BAA-789]|uniref:Uncharacterized protein n=1 Tax=Sanguibacter hominis ATCC BAA-789 TaxID=1312740 RepID=A0A9X5FD75_9MICO|nr:hypothetical protein [Sanguibacter hominis]NKX94245.1 hypothetical protein [Sanguibacter hominis ATCC BAA-789]
MRSSRHQAALAARRSVIIRSSMAVLAIGGIAGVASVAAFSSSVVVQAEVVAGTLDINLDGKVGTEASPYMLPLTTGKIEAGSTKTTTVQVNNTGSVDSVLGLVTSVETPTSGLAGQLTATVKDGSTTLYDGKLASATFDKVTLNGGATKTLTVTVTAPNNLANAYKGTADSVRLVFNAVQASAMVDTP